MFFPLNLNKTGSVLRHSRAHRKTGERFAKRLISRRRGERDNPKIAIFSRRMLSFNCIYTQSRSAWGGIVGWRETGMTAQNKIVLATSIPPALSRRDGGREIGAEYQRLCMRSWRDCGFRILSINDESEIPELSARHPGIVFVPAARNASAITEIGRAHV